jgi:cysteine synthase A
VTISTVLDILERPRVVAIKSRLYAIVFDLIKVVAARYVLREAAARGEIDSRTRIFESTSGTMGLALALACREREQPLTIVGDDVAFDAELRNRLEVLGADVALVHGPFAEGGPQAARIRRMQELRANRERSFWTQQYHNAAMREAYVAVGHEISARIGHLDSLIAPCGTGASSCGLIQGIRSRDPRARLVAVDTHGSVLFGQPDDHRFLRGLGNSIHPRNLVHEFVDECHWVTADEASIATRELYYQFGIDAGPSSGAAFLVASWLQQNYPDSTNAFVCADTGERYRRTLLNESWLRERGLWRATLPDSPTRVSDPHACPTSWCRMEWNRRSLCEVLTMSSEAPDLRSSTS